MTNNSLEFAVRQRMMGLSDAGLIPALECAWEGLGAEILLAPEVREAFRTMRNAALKDGIDLRIVSGWRGFSRQLSIWNRKMKGELPLLDRSGSLLDRNSLDGDELLWSILTWSALPGASRHHWGSDLDVADASAVPSQYEVQLTTEEFEGPFSRLNQWLGIHGATFGFFRPYVEIQGGISPEPWHLSWAPLAREFELAFDVVALRNVLQRSGIIGMVPVLRNLDRILDSHVRCYFGIA